MLVNKERLNDNFILEESEFCIVLKYKQKEVFALSKNIQDNHIFPIIYKIKQFKEGDNFV